ncbi:MAG: GNAT family N-acetyltransferase [Steroidobacter sp.]
MSIQWQWRQYAELSPQQIYAIFAARQAVFIVEQNCPYLDMDGKDLEALHLIAWSGDDVAAYLRVIAPGVSFTEPSLGRIITTKIGRGTGLGRELVARGLNKVYELYPTLPTRIGAQAHLHKFYGSLGFAQASEPYDEDGIPHIEMLRPAGPAR